MAAAAAPSPSGAIKDDGKLLSLVVFFRPPGPPGESAHAYIVADAYNVGDFSFLYRGSIREYLTFSSRTVAKLCPAGNRLAVKYEQYIAYCISRYRLV
jgi:hypothetical protein